LRVKVLQEFLAAETILNNFIHHKSGSNEYKDKQTNITKLTLSSIFVSVLDVFCLK